MFQQRRRGPGLGLVLLAAQVFNIGIENIPPVTLAVVGLNAAIYLKLLNNMPRLRNACVSAEFVWEYGDWKRLILASFYHLDDWHLYYNMASFLWKGISLERSLGTAGFLYVLAVFSVLTNIILVALDILLARAFNDPSYLYTCAAGFSGVIFALKVLTTYNLPSGVSHVMGMFPVPIRYACWAELVLIQLLVPNASFTGHLAGILVGLLYVKGPLKPLMNSLASAVSGGRGRFQLFGQPSYSYHSAPTGTRQLPGQARNENEELQAAIQASLQDTHRYPVRAPNEDPDLRSAIAESLRSPQVPTQTNHSGEAHAQLYTRLPETQTTEEEQGTNSPPYPLRNKMPSPDDLRQRRLRHFDR